MRPVASSDRAAAPLGGGFETGAPVHRGDRVELVGGRRRRHHVICGDGDLDLGGQQSRPRQRVGDTGEGRTDQRGSRVGAALGEAEEGEPRLGVAAQLVTLAVRVLGAIEIAAQPSDLTDLVAAFGDDADVDVGGVRGRPAPPRPGLASKHRGSA